uniref:GrBNV_gp22-like protein n=1 Tax=Nilaparvata lugens endogenous nudivirus TaxID=1487700 RepID=X5GWA2_9VIRU|nr:GrBNV_gp22-like protein [Nilaparvata lugens endogenous nudivirus]
MSKQLQFSEYTTSKLLTLYGNPSDNNDYQTLYSNVEACQPELKLESQTIKLDDIQRKIIDQSEYIDSIELDQTIIPKLDTFCYDTIDTLMKTLDSAPADNQSCNINLVKIEHFEQVKAYTSDIIGGKFLPPRFRPSVGKVSPSCSVRINTGYIITIPDICKPCKLVNGKIVQEEKFIPQPQFVILPCFHLNEQQKSDIIPCVYSRDPEDTGLLTFSFTTRSGDVGDVLVVLKAFATATQITNSFHITKSELAGAVQTIAKPRDFKNGRYTANLKIKFDAASMEVQDSSNSTPIALFKTYNTAVCPEAHHKQQRLVFDATRNIVLFSSRKREWFNKHLTTFSGVLTKSKHLVPFVARSGNAQEIIANTHCCTLIESKRSLFSTILDHTEQPIGAMKIINGAFANIDQYDGMRKSMKQLVKGLSGLSTGVKHCRRLQTQDPKLISVGMNNLLKLYDYHRVVSANSKLYENVIKGDKEIQCRNRTAFSSTKLFAIWHTSTMVCRSTINHHQQQLNQIQI